MVKAAGIELLGDLVPAERGRHGSFRRAGAPSRRRRSSSLRRSGSRRPGPPDALPSPIPSSRARDGVAPASPQRSRRTPVSVVGVAACDRDEDMEAVRAARLRKAGEPERVENILDESATRTTSGKPTSGDGSRSNRTQSGRSGLSTREYQVFMSMQPMLAIQSSASSSLTSGYRSVRFSRVSREVERYSNLGIHSGMCEGASFWKKCLPCHRLDSASW